MRRPSSKIDRQLDGIAARHHGVVTAAEAKEIGISKSNLQTRLRSGFLVKAGYGCYVLPARSTGLTEAALVQARYPRAVLAGRSAAFEYGLDGFDRRQARTDHVVSRRPRQPAPDMVVVPVRVADVTRIEGLATLRPAPLLATLGYWAGPDDVEAALECVLRRGMATEGELREWTNGRRPDFGLGALMARRGWGVPPTESMLETLAVQRVFRPQGFAIARQVEVRTPDDVFLGRVDFELNEVLLVETLGAAFHTSPEQWKQDLWRSGSLRLAGRELEQITWDDVTRRPFLTGRRLHTRCEQLSGGTANICSSTLAS